MNARYQAHPDILQTDLGDELVLVDGRNGHSYRLNASARCIWMRLPASQDELERALTDAFDVSPATAFGDAEAVVAHLLEQGLLIKSA